MGEVGGVALQVKFYENSSNRVHDYFASMFYMIKKFSSAKQQSITISLMNARAGSVWFLMKVSDVAI